MGLAHSQRGDGHEALAWLQRAVALGGRTNHALVLIRTACEIGEFDNALEACLRGLEGNPEDERLQCAYPQTLLESGHPAAAPGWLEADNTGTRPDLAAMKYKAYTDLHRAENARQAQWECQRRTLRANLRYRDQVLSVLRGSPDNAARIELAELWLNSLNDQIDSDTAVKAEEPFNLTRS